MSGEIELKIRKLGLELPEAPAAVGSYAPALQVGNLVVTSGQLPFDKDGIAFAGRIGAELGIGDGTHAARICILNALAQIKATVGDLDRVKQIVRVEGYVHSAPGFRDQPKVLNGASELLNEIFGDAGKHTRIALGVSEMPLNAAVQIAVWAEVEASD